MRTAAWTTTLLAGLARLACAAPAPQPDTADIQPALTHVADARFELGPTIPSGATPRGNFSYVAVTGGSFNTTDGSLRARIIAGGSDYARIREDGGFGIDVRTAALSADPEPVLLEVASYGVVAPGLQLAGDASPAFGAVDAWQALRVNTLTSARFGWLNGAALVAQERVEIVGGAVRVVALRVYRFDPTGGRKSS